VPVQLIGTGRSERTLEQWKGVAEKSFATQDVEGPEADATLESTVFIQGDPTDPKHLQKLLDAAEASPVLYFALPPQIASDICDALQHVDLPEDTTLAFEKPFGTGVASVEALNETVLKLVPEERVHRTDHFLGRTTVLNIIGLRFANRLFEPIWNADNIEKVDVFYDETLGLENRAQYYDEAGALADMIQSHLLQILGLVTMDAPSAIDAVEFRSSLARVLRSTRLKGDDPKTASRRAVYTEGTIDGRELPSYQSEGGVDASRKTDTLAEIEIEIEVDTARWKGVPFTLRSGKALGAIPKDRSPCRPRSATASSPRTARSSTGSSTTTRCCRSAATWPSAAGRSSNRSSRPGRRTRSRSRSTAPAPAGRRTGSRAPDLAR
jgi:glucose-6-phosphate 1-dehydrogenase